MNIFLLSPANTGGLRAKQLMSPRAQFEAARMYQSADGVPIGLAFAFMSALYFRGKIAYALHFGGVDNTYVIAPGFGLVHPDWRITQDRMKILQKTPVDIRNRRYCTTLKKESKALAARLADEDRVVLLGSVASGKYVDILWPVFGEKLVFPGIFAGLGDMSRGGLLLRAMRADKQLEYTPLSAPRQRNNNDPVELARAWARENSQPMGPAKKS